MAGMGYKAEAAVDRGSAPADMDFDLPGEVAAASYQLRAGGADQARAAAELQEIR